jgi:beta-phosphoglucomutase-like phosphatase (HAD superfamily)
VTSGRSADRPGGGGPTLSLPGRFRAAVFDLDGLLIDTEPGWQRAEAELLRRRGLAYSEADAAASLGSPVGQMVDLYAARLGLDVLQVDERIQQRCIDTSIWAVKAGENLTLKRRLIAFAIA